MKSPFSQSDFHKFFLPSVFLFSSIIIATTAFSAKLGDGKNILPVDKARMNSGFNIEKKPMWDKFDMLQAMPVEELPLELKSETILPPVDTIKSQTLGAVEIYDSTPQSEPIQMAVQVDDILGHSREIVVSMVFGDPKTQTLVQFMMNTADESSANADGAYDVIRSMYSEVDAMKAQLATNYEIYNQSKKTDSEAKDFNKQSDAMADRVVSMISSISGLHDYIAADRAVLESMSDALNEIAENSKNGSSYYDKAFSHLKDVSNRFDQLSKNLLAQDAVTPASLEQLKKYLTALQEYVSRHKSYSTDQIEYLYNVKSYVDKIKTYVDKVLVDIRKAKADLTAMEKYFRDAKVGPRDDRKIETAPEESDICKNAETKGMSSLKDCTKSCRSVCRFKEKVGDTNCYECPSGSPGSCYDVKAWPDNHPWCQPGGICHDDPMMFCSPFGTMSPNKEPLSCTKCQKRPDMCWQKVGDGTMTYTNCKLGCWNGKCVYKGKYEEFEWDGKSEKIHCYKCETPPPPPTCEDLGWGTTWKSDCEKMCPAPGQCVKENHVVPGAPQPPPNNNPNPGDPQNPQGGENEGTGTGEDAGNAGTGGKPANPPSGTPEQPGGGLPPSGGGSITGGGSLEPRQPGTETPQGGGEDQPQQPPTTGEPTNPGQPTGDKPKPPEPPPPPPDTPQISMYKEQLARSEERIKSREDIINDPNESDAVKDEARRQLESMTRERDLIKKNLEEEQRRELEKIKNEEERKKRQEEWERTRVRTPDYAEEARKRGEAWLLNQLKNATNALEAKLKEAQDAITGRRERLERIRREIEQLENENKYYKENEDNGTFDSDFTQTRIKQNKDRINELKRQYAELDKKLREAVAKYNEELQRLQSDYRRALWAYDKKSQARADAQRTDEYFDLYNDLLHRQATRAERNRAFNEVAENLETAIRDKKAKGEDTSDLERQLENLRRGQKEWDDSLQRQEDYIKSQMHEMERRNFYEGAGPTSPEDLAGSLAKYGKQFESQLSEAQKKIAELEGTKNRTPEQNKLLESLRTHVTDLKGSIAAVAEKQTALKGGLTPEEQQRVYETTLRVANGAMSTDADKSYARLALESLGEEIVHTANPFVAAKKSLAFGVGVVQGVGSAVKGLVELGVGAVDLTLEVYLTNLGFDIETDALDAVNGLLDGVSSNMNFDGVIKAVVAAGGAIDAKIKELEKSTDIDWDTSNFGGKVAGEVAVGDAVIGATLGKAGKALGLIDEAADAGRAVGKADELLDAERAAARAGEAAPTRGPPGSPHSGPKTELVDIEVPRTAKPEPHGPKTEIVDVEVPKTGVVEPTKPTGPVRGGVGEHGTATYVDANGKTVTVQTGKELGHGSTSVVFEDPTNKRRAIRITEPGRGGIENAPQLDAAGRKAVEGIQTENSAIRITKKGEPVLITDPNSPLNGKIVEYVERVDNGSADKFLQGKPMSTGQAEALDKATRELNNAGYAWMDNHAGNYGFEKVEGTTDQWRVVVLDPGGIVPMKGNSLAEKAQNARALQQRLIPEKGTKEFLEMMDQRGPDGRENFIKRERGAIMGEHGQNIDVDAMHIKSPYDIAFYPMGTLGYENVQTLGRLTDAEAALRYTIK